MKKVFYILSTLLIISAFQLSAQTQKGQDMLTGSLYDKFGYSVSMPNTYTIAVGATGKGPFAQVSIYSWNGNSWSLKGLRINGETANDGTGFSVSMPDSKTIAIGAPFNNGNGFYSGNVRIYKWSGNTWIQKGIDIDGETSSDESGFSVSMPDSNTVAIGAHNNSNSNGSEAGHVRVYKWNGIAWIQKGIDIDGEAFSDDSGWSVSMPDSNTVAIGAPDNYANNFSGQVRIYSWNGLAWVQKGIDIDGEATVNYSGWSVSMPDSNTVAIGAPKNNNSNGIYAGHVRIYKWNGIAWIQKGIDIDGKAASSEFGYSVSMPDSNTVAIGAKGVGALFGYTYIYKWNGIAWLQKGITLKGDSIRDRFGSSVNMPDSNTVGVGQPYEFPSVNAGKVKVYSFCDSATASTISPIFCDSYMSPSGNYKWTTSGTYQDVIHNSVGCDSIITINLTIQNTRDTIAPTACFNYISPSGKYNWRISGTYMDTIPNINSCDSIITIQLTVKAVDISTGRVSNSLISNAFGASYQWVNCDNNYAPILGDTNQIFTPTATGNYAVIVTKNGCVDTSRCNFVVVVGLIENTFDDINIYPNPTNGKVTIDLGSNNLKVNLKVNDINGLLIQEKSNINTKQIALDLSNHSKGVYFITLQNETSIRVVKLVKN